MDATTYTAGITNAWHGERWAHVFFSKLADSTESEEHRTKWQALAKLEEVMGNRLNSILETENPSPPDDEPAIDERLSVYLPLTYTDKLKRLSDVVDPAIVMFKELLDHAPAEHRKVVKLLCEHEIAIKEFVERELAQDGSDSLAPILDALTKITN